jgi:hypothetical protein
MRTVPGEVALTSRLIGKGVSDAAVRLELSTVSLQKPRRQRKNTE